ncbi:MAG: twin-arginine translocase TatA/TatE family subunit [Anaerolineae bacterium]|nr:MAG: twin-arginine translocase TatA/TatE family subunit [Anaerolineae bacterium]
MNLGPTELIIILIIVMLLFGVGRISKIGEELGKGIRAFKEGLQSAQEDESTEAEAANKTEEQG